MEIYEISSYALDFLMEGSKLRKTNPKMAAKYFSISWAFNAMQEYDEGMRICDMTLERLGIPHNKLSNYHEYGFKVITKVLDNVKKINQILSHGRQSNKETTSLNTLIDSAYS